MDCWIFPPDVYKRQEYLTAQHIIPLTVRSGRITEAAFVSDVLDKGANYIYLEQHLLEADGYVVHNAYFKQKNDQMEPVQMCIRDRSYGGYECLG